MTDTPFVPDVLCIEPADLAPGDGRAAGLDWSGLSVHLLSSPGDPLIGPVYQRLWNEFSSHGGMEQLGVILARLAWEPSRPINRWCFLYRLIAVCRDGVPVGMRDCTAMLHRQHPDHVLVHLSHVLVDFEFRGGGLAAWLRAFPVQIARWCHAAAGYSGRPRVTLIAEMEHPDPTDPASLKRLASYERAGFQKVDPSVVDYHQPDFRDPREIDASGGPKPLPFVLIVRRVGREAEPTLAGHEAKLMIQALYSMYGVHFRSTDMAAVWRMLDRFPADDAAIRLLPPTSL